MKALLKERQELLDKKFANKFSPTERNRLALIRWSLDRIEDAMYGAALDDLETAVAK